MVYIKELRECLEEWNHEVSDERITDFDWLISIICMQIGYSDFDSKEFRTNSVQELEKHLIKLSKSTAIFEEIIVDGILFNIYSILNRNISNRDNDIRHSENLLANVEKSSRDVNKVKEMALANLDRLQAPNYIEIAEKELKLWKKVYEKHFSLSEREILLREKDKLMLSTMKKNMSDDERQQFEEIKAEIRG
ncbi:hypothetical protein [Lysinibacillus sp. NPDC093688]|uniref:hypothetical protein n=1 Tax=Lysinibacillus sp. NPDC093688 TaxID=3390577 RepID=UPI003D056D50